MQTFRFQLPALRGDYSRMLQEEVVRCQWRHKSRDRLVRESMTLWSEMQSSVNAVTSSTCDKSDINKCRVLLENVTVVNGCSWSTSDHYRPNSTLDNFLWSRMASLKCCKREHLRIHSMI